MQVNAFIAHNNDPQPKEIEDKDKIDHDFIQYLQTADRWDKNDSANIELSSNDFDSVKDWQRLAGGIQESQPKKSYFVDMSKEGEVPGLNLNYDGP